MLVSTLYVCQRTPSSVDERGNKPTDPAWVKTLRVGWQDYRNTNFCSILSGRPVEEDLVGDKWTSLSKTSCPCSPRTALF